MKNHRLFGGMGRHFTHPALFDRRRGGFPDDSGEGRGRHGHHHHRGGRGGGRRGGRLFDYGELRLLVLALLADNPAHGYELIKAIEERFGGSYTPSPGVIYPTLSWLDDMGYATVEASEGNRKRYRATDEGMAFLQASRAQADELLARAGDGEGGRAGVPAPVIRAMGNLKLAMRLRFRDGPIDEAAAEAIAAALDEAARIVEKSK